MRRSDTSGRPDAARKPISLRSVLAAAALVCWLLPILIVTVTAGVLLNRSYSESLRQSLEADAGAAMDQAALRLAAVIEDSKAVSYDGVARQAYRDYQLGGAVEFFIYRDTTDYLVQKFARGGSYRAVFISFPAEGIHTYAAAPGISRQNLLRHYTETVLPAAQELLAGRDTGIWFMTVGESLYMVRNLLDQDFTPYAALVMELEPTEIFQSLENLRDLLTPELTVDGVSVFLWPDGGEAETSGTEVVYTAEADGHTLELTARVAADPPWSDTPMLLWVIAGVVLMVIPLLGAIVWLFRQYLGLPIEVLTAAAGRIQAGERGYQITETTRSQEFTLLYNHFNSMSAELASQFERSYQEQQALQQAKIKALQSQINPHFLNNTLEVINWEARLADNERVCSMIEALSTMLSAAIGRDGRSTATLAEELKYVDAYLYITQERLGDRLTVTREIDPQVLDRKVMLLMLQPIVENAVEHDLSHAGGELCLRACAYGSDGARLRVEVEHDGTIPARDWENIRRSLASGSGPPEAKGSVGLRNVNQRLRLLYGEDYRFEMLEPRPGRILTRLELPVKSGSAGEKRKEGTP